MIRRVRRAIWKARMYWKFHMRDQLRARIAAARKAHRSTKELKAARHEALRQEVGK